VGVLQVQQITHYDQIAAVSVSGRGVIAAWSCPHIEITALASHHPIHRGTTWYIAITYNHCKQVSIMAEESNKEYRCKIGKQRI